MPTSVEAGDVTSTVSDEGLRVGLLMTYKWSFGLSIPFGRKVRRKRIPARRSANVPPDDLNSED
jgi:hypothetical protein